MAVEVNVLKLLLLAQRIGVSFETTLMLGRQNVVGMTADEMVGIFDGFNRRIELATARQILKGRYAEPLLTELGARSADSMDGSGYEGATIVHDLNSPVPAQLFNRFSAVFDGGTLEHVFQFPTALRSAMQMVRPGGHYIAMSPINNFMGHGLYQLSPELYIGAFSEENGFAIERMMLVENFSNQWFEVIDPSNLQTGVQVRNPHPTFVFFIARKTSDKADILAKPPQQGLYSAQWSAPSKPARGTGLYLKALGLLNRNPALYRTLYRAAVPLESFVALRRSKLMRHVRPEDLS